MFRYKDYSLLCNKKWRINIEIVELLSDKGIHLFNISSDFYHQRYFGFNYNGNDITTSDIQSDVYTSVSVCESGCKVQKELMQLFCCEWKLYWK